MRKRIAVISDIHGNLEALNAILEDVKNQDIDDIICLGDTINIGPNSKECIDLLIENNVKSVLGNHELYLLRGDDIDSSIGDEEKLHYKWVKASLTDKEIDYISKCPLYYDYSISYNEKAGDKRFIFTHYFINNEKDIYPFEKNNLINDINLWKKYNDENIIYFVGHLHESFDVNEVNGILDDYIEDDGVLTNIEIIDSAGCTKDNYTSYLIIEISKNICYKKIKLEYEREKFINKVLTMKFPRKKNILKYFYGIE